LYRNIPDRKKMLVNVDFPGYFCLSATGRQTGRATSGGNIAALFTSARSGVEPIRGLSEYAVNSRGPGALPPVEQT
jgi:hypothetical protein